MVVEKLSNGITLAIKKRSDVYSVSIQFYLKTGALWENDNNRGIAHFLEHMVFNGTENFKPGEIEKIVENAGGELNAATSYDYTVYYITIPSKHLNLAVKLLKELVFKPSLFPEMVEKEKPIVLEEIARSLNEPKSLMWLNLFKEIFPDLNYKHPILGYPETVKSFTDKTAKEFHEKFYCGSNLTVAICGNLNEKEVLKTLQEELREIPEGEKSKFDKKKTLKVEPKKLTQKHPAVANIHTVMAWRLPGIIENKDLRKLSILESLLSYGKSSLFYQEIVESGTAYAASAGLEEFLGGSIFYIYGITQENKTETFKRKVKEIISQKLKDESLFEFAKKKIVKAETFKQESIDVDTDAIGYTLTIYEDIKKYENFLEEIKNETFKNFSEKTQFLTEKPIEIQLLPENVEAK